MVAAAPTGGSAGRVEMDALTMARRVSPVSGGGDARSRDGRGRVCVENECTQGRIGRTSRQCGRDG
jgi:hypothetical protein